MPADDYNGRALALPLDDEETGDTPVWSRRSTSSFRRNPSHQGAPSLRQRAMTTYDKLNRRVTDQYNKLSPIQKVLFVVGSIAVAVLGILFLVYNETLLEKLQPYARKWRDIRGGWLILWALIFTVSFPPLIGYSTLLTMCGFVYGFPNGYVIPPFHLISQSYRLTHPQLVHSSIRHHRRQHRLLPPLALALEKPRPPPHCKRQALRSPRPNPQARRPKTSRHDTHVPASVLPFQRCSRYVPHCPLVQLRTRHRHRIPKTHAAYLHRLAAREDRGIGWENGCEDKGD
jgi:hypothetical protein